MNSNDADGPALISLILTDPMIFPLVPPERRDAVNLLWTLNNRLAEMAAAGKEPALRQIRLRWWADQLALTANGTVPPEPLLAEVATGLTPLLGADALAALAESWMEPAAADPAEDMPGEQGAQLFALTATLLGGGEDPRIASAGRLWARVAARLSHDASAAGDWSPLATDAAASSLAGLPRPLAVLTALTRSVAQRHGQRSWRREQLLVLRVGLFGR
jgi:phytoene synthase